MFTASSVQLDGVDDVVDMGPGPYNLGCCAGDEFSLSIWYKIAGISGEAHLMGAQNPSSIRRGYFVHFDANGNVCFSIVANINAPNSAGFARKCTPTPPSVGVWHHVVATSAPFGSGSLIRENMTLYLDGELVATSGIGNQPTSQAFSNSGAGSPSRCRDVLEHQ